jgi:hypothetical protein
MIDFTKEELQIIYNFFERHRQDSYDDCRYASLLKKIQSMLDNYCEHEQAAIPEVVYKCLKCGVFYR